MKISRILFIAIVALCITACDENSQFEKELYKKVINILSDDDLVFSVNHDLSQEETIGYISIGCGGTNHITEDVTVELEPDGEGLAKYNKLKYDLEESKFAHELEAWRYDIPSYTTVLKADDSNTYATIPVRVRPEGLSPDSVYLIPLRIKSISEYEINSDKSTALYRVLLKNNYALQSPTTYYKAMGSYISYRENGEIEKNSTFSLSRVVVPLTKNTIRFFAGLNTYETSTLTKEAIDKYAIRVTINEDNSLAFSSIGSAQVEIVDDPEYNFYFRYETEYGLGIYHAFYLRYRFRVLKEGADGSNGDADYGGWTEMIERMAYGESTL